MKVERKGDELIITLPINKELPLSPTKKTKQVASSKGNIATDLEIEGKKVTVGVNAYISAK